MTFPAVAVVAPDYVLDMTFEIYGHVNLRKYYRNETTFMYNVVVISRKNQ